MNAITPIPPAALPSDSFDRAVLGVNEWRGRCLNAFTQGEVAVTECLLALSKSPGRNGLVGLPHLLGQRLESLAAAIGVDGPFADEGRHAAAALARFREHTSFRNMLCHGVTEMTLDRKARWTVVLRLTALRSGRVDTEVSVFRKVDAERLASDVGSASRSLRAHLENLTSGLSIGRPANA